MPAESESQKHLMCIGLAYKRHGKSALRDVKNTEKVIELANSMSEEELKEYCLSPVKG